MPKTAFFASAWALCLLALMQSYGAQAAPSGGGVSVYPSVDGLVDVQSMDVFVEGRRLHALLVAKFSTSAQVSAFYVFSIDGGRTWSKPVSLARKDETPVISRRGNDAQLATNGKHMVAVWQTRGEYPGSGPMVVAYSGDGGLTWARGESPASGDPSRNQSYMDLTVDRAGSFHLAWPDDREEKGNTQGLRYASSMDGGHRWLAETTIDDAVCTCCWNRLAVSPDQTVSVLYRDDAPHDMRLAERPSFEGHWQRLGAVGAFNWQFTGCPHCGGGLAAIRGKQDVVLHSVVWTGQENSAGLYYLSSMDHGRSWSKPRRIGGGLSREADIAAASPSRLTVVFSERSAEGIGIRFIRSTDGGRTWSNPGPLTTPGVDADDPRILSTALGLWAFWTENRPGGTKVWAMGFPERS